MTPKQLSAWLRDWRARLDLTQHQAAELLELSFSTYRNAEYDRGFPYELLLVTTCEALEADAKSKKKGKAA